MTIKTKLRTSQNGESLLVFGALFSRWRPKIPKFNTHIPKPKNPNLKCVAAAPTWTSKQFLAIVDAAFDALTSRPLDGASGSVVYLLGAAAAGKHVKLMHLFSIRGLGQTFLLSPQVLVRTGRRGISIFA